MIEEWIKEAIPDICLKEFGKRGHWNEICVKTRGHDDPCGRVTTVEGVAMQLRRLATQYATRQPDMAETDGIYLYESGLLKGYSKAYEHAAAIVEEILQ